MNFGLQCVPRGESIGYHKDIYIVSKIVCGWFFLAFFVTESLHVALAVLELIL